jgi:hypothetical protein
MDGELARLLRGNPALWRGGEVRDIRKGLGTGFEALDAALPGGGWPAHALVEIISPQQGIGELRLLLPVMARLGRSGRRIVWIAPPHIPYAPALEQAGIRLEHLSVLNPGESDLPWAMETVLRAGACGMALAWPARLDVRKLRRLQLAAEAGRCLGVIFRRADPGVTAAALRLRLQDEAGALRIQILKARGGCRRPELRVQP